MPEREPSPGWALYLRVSNEDKQSPERSFAMQRLRIEEQLLRGSDLQVHHEYCDLLTGTTPRRADYQQMLADAEAGKFSHLALYRADRFGRNAVEGLQAATRLISFGVRIRVAHMPSLAPETPDGFFMFMIQMGMAQREVEVMRQRIGDGMLAKLSAGGWASKAPDGYLNKEQLISSGKYHRWVELDPERRHVLREAWDLLLTDRYSLADICEELAARGYTRASGRPWAWTRTKAGARDQCTNYLSKIFNNPFYAGWVVSPKYGIEMGRIRGTWEAIVSTKEFERGRRILRKHHTSGSQEKRHFYLLRDLLSLSLGRRQYKLYCTTPSGRSRSYPYYHAQIEREKRSVHIRCEVVDSQIPMWLRGVVIDPEFIPDIRQTYQEVIRQTAASQRNIKVDDVQRRISQLREEEAQMVRLLVTGKVSETVYENLRAEWQEKLRNAQSQLEELERDLSRYLDDLDCALILLTRASELFLRFSPKEQHALLRIIVKRLVVNADGRILSYELQSPFSYLRDLNKGFSSKGPGQRRSRKPKVVTSARDIDRLTVEETAQFLSSLHLEQRAYLSDLPGDAMSTSELGFADTAL